MHITNLFVYPVKSLRGCAVDAASVDELGLVGDRRFLVVDASGQFLTQRVLPRMALIATALDDTDLSLRADGFGQIRVPLRADDAPVRTVSIWKSAGLKAEDCGDDCADWLHEMLAVECRLVRIGAQFHRPMTKSVAHPGDAVAFPDAFPFMIVSEGSLAELNRRIVSAGEPPVPMNRFRPSFVVSGGEPHVEDTWPRIKAGNLILRAGGPCGRCIVTTTDQQTGERGKEPLRTLNTYRRAADEPTTINFGQNFIHETKVGSLRVGDEVTVLPLT
ncbi:MAG TPA: MOSC N-terminal beta barrel domain-containing protein [Opitutaceae bacterium]|nr:MOSC N-terminal beta barrel domain-containing protein [Opitutaceae bacterium]